MSQTCLEFWDKYPGQHRAMQIPCWFYIRLIYINGVCAIFWLFWNVNLLKPHLNVSRYCGDQQKCLLQLQFQQFISLFCVIVRIFRNCVVLHPRTLSDGLNIPKRSNFLEQWRSFILYTYIHTYGYFLIGLIVPSCICTCMYGQFL